MTTMTRKHVVTKRIIGAVLNEDFDELDALLRTATPSEVSRLGDCGETAAHVAVYKANQDLLAKLIVAGADPMDRNRKGYSLVDISVILGHSHILQALYETGNCNLREMNHKGQTPLQLAQAPFEEEDLRVARLFKNWEIDTIDDEASAAYIVAGRKRCEEFLMEKIRHDKRSKIQRLTEETKAWNVKREHLRKILGPPQFNQDMVYTTKLSYPERHGEPKFTASEADLFDHYPVGINVAATHLFASQLVNNAIQQKLNKSS